MFDMIIQFIVPALCGILIYYIIPILKEKNLYEYVKIGVLAAEQLLGSGKGKEKLEYVIKFVKEKFKVTDEQLRNLIEAVVFELNSAKQKEI